MPTKKTKNEKTKNGRWALSLTNVIVLAIAAVAALSAFYVLRGDVASARDDIEEIEAYQVREVRTVHPDFITEKELGYIIEPMYKNIERIEVRQMKMEDKIDIVLDEIRKIPKG